MRRRRSATACFSQSTARFHLRRRSPSILGGCLSPAPMCSASANRGGFSVTGSSRRTTSSPRRSLRTRSPRARGPSTSISRSRPRRISRPTRIRSTGATGFPTARSTRATSTTSLWSAAASAARTSASAVRASSTRFRSLVLRRARPRRCAARRSAVRGGFSRTASAASCSTASAATGRAIPIRRKRDGRMWTTNRRTRS